MPIVTDKNTGYGPLLVSQKYAPLLDIELAAKDRLYYGSLLTNRGDLLRNQNLTRTLNLVTSSWNTIIGSEAGKSPPLVVISSNRSKWIKSGIEAADEQLKFLGQPAFQDVSDLNALTARIDQQVSPPLYCPKRIGLPLNRNVYIVVHLSEYTVYKGVLAGAGVTIIGWEFKLPIPRRASNKIRLVGFGASRFAAIEFCKVLRTQAAGNGPAPWSYAWLLDDNVVALSSFPGFTAIETAMKPGQVCAGFQGGTKAETSAENQAWAKRLLKEGHGQQTNTLPNIDPKGGIVQQASLWNIAYLTANFLNFSPVYIASGEDLSISKYFEAQKIPYVFYSGSSIRKELADADGTKSAKNVSTARQNLTAWVVDAENETPPGKKQPPPPVQVLPRNKRDDGDLQTVGEFVGRVLKSAKQMEAVAGQTSIQNTAKCQAVEQITCKALEKDYVLAPALAATFKLNGDRNQAVMRLDG